MFRPTFESLGTYQCPDWYRDAKFGIWSHWGPQSVPMCGDWYARNIYRQGEPQYLEHMRRYGHPSVFGYKDIVKLWKAERFHPEELMDLFKRSGARFFMGMAMHHDHFFLYPSKLNPMNAMNVGPLRDIAGLWRDAARNAGLPFGLSEHLGASFTWWNYNKGCDTYGPYAGVPYDGNDPEWRDFYLDNREHVTFRDDGVVEKYAWYTKNKQFHDYWLAVFCEFVDLYQPELVYTDGGIPFGLRSGSELPGTVGLGHDDRDYQNGLEAIAYLYNASVTRSGENRAVFLQKDDRPEIRRVGILDVEMNQLPDISDQVWQTCTSTGVWFPDARQPYKPPGHNIEMLVDIVSKNGVMLLNVMQRADGTLDDETRWIVEEIGAWMEICGEGIYGTRPWRVFAEGSSRAGHEGALLEDPAAVSVRERRGNWKEGDYRFACKGNILYAFLMRTPENRQAIVKSLTPADAVRSVKLLGEGHVPYVQDAGGLTVTLPPQMPTPYVNALAIELA